jgi:hypothetical protein
MREFNLIIEHSSDATFDRHWSRIVYLISSNLFVEMGVNINTKKKKMGVNFYTIYSL